MRLLPHLRGNLASVSVASERSDVVKIDREPRVLPGFSCHVFSQRRESTASYAASAFSGIHLHSETINIWSHLLGAVWFFSSLVHFTVTYGGTTPSKDTAAIWAYLTTISLCFASSALYHLFANHKHAALWQILDHVGIIGSIWSSSTSFTILSSAIAHNERWIFFTLFSAAAVSSLYRLLDIRIHDHHARKRRISTHVALGVFAAMPALHAWLQSSQGAEVELLAEFAWLFIINSTGGSIYASHALDKSVGMDIGLPDLSHHVMHIMVIVGAWIYKQGILSLYRKRVA